jgi:hypothetical protein
MRQAKKEEVEQINYKDRWYDKKDFGVMLYSIDSSILVKSTEEIEDLKSSGKWFETRNDAKEAQLKAQVKRKKAEKVVPIETLDDIKEEDYGIPDGEAVCN